MPLSLPQNDFLCRRFIYFELLWHPILEPPVSTTLRGGEEAGCGATWDQAPACSQSPWGEKFRSIQKCVLGSASSPPPLRTAAGVGLCPFPPPLEH